MAARIDIREALDGPDLEAVRALCRSFRAWLYERYPEDRDAVDAYYSPDVFEGFLARLPTLHGPPDGAILLATADGRPAGCVMLRKFEGDICEMNRLFVATKQRGHGIGLVLCKALLATAARMGYRSMRLDTGPLHHEAQALYSGLGFAVREAYYDPGPELRDKLVFMERDLTGPLPDE